MSNYSQITRHNKCTSNVKCMLHENLRNLQLFSGFLLTQSEWGGWVGPVTFLANIRWCKGLQTGLINLLSCFYQYLQVAPESLDISSHFDFLANVNFTKNLITTFRGCFWLQLIYINTRFAGNFKTNKHCTKKMKFSIKDFFRKCDQIRSFLQIWSHFLKNSLMKSSLLLQWKQQQGQQPKKYHCKI